jgi:uncharacterized protein (DUF2147 family)
MVRDRKTLIGAAVSLFGVAWPVAAQDAPIVGTWRTELSSEITIAPCDAGFCGQISTIVVPDHLLEGATGEAIAALTPDDYVDANNEDPALRERPILGLQILTLEPSSDGRVHDGQIYNPEDGKTYSGYVEILGPDQVRLNGCVLFNTLCRGETWQRVPAPVEEIE